MTSKRWLAAIAILCILAIAFFWGGDVRNQPMQPEDGPSESLALTGDAAPSNTGEPAGSMKPEVSATPEASKEPAPSEASEAFEASTATEATEETAEGAGQAKPDQAAESVQPAGTNRPDKPLPSKDEDASTPKETGGASEPDRQSSTGGPASTGKPSGQVESKPEATPPPKDKYLTDPVPEGKPAPVEWQDVTVDKRKKLTVTLSVTAASILDHMDMFNKDKLEVLPEDGVIYKAQAVTAYEGESAFDVLLREMKKNKIHMEFVMTPIYNSNYVEGINNLYEFDCGELSGWMFKVNGWFPNYGSSRYKLQDGDVVEWVYTCDLGRDIGGDMS